MTTTKSFSEKSRFASLYRSALKGQVAFGIIALILFVILIPLIYFVSVDNPASLGLSDPAEIARWYADREVLQNGAFTSQGHASIVLFALVGFAFVIALVQNNYLHSKKMTDFYHAIPVKRQTLLAANMLASMTTLLVPYIVVYLVTVAMQAAMYGKYMTNLSLYLGFMALDLISALLAVAVVYIFTAFIAVNVGTVFDNFALAAVLGLSPLIVYSIVVVIWELMTYGAVADYEIVVMLSPFTFIFKRFLLINSHYIAGGGQMPVAELTKVLPYYGIWLLIGAVLFFGTVACYRRRRSEIAEQMQPTGIFQTICKCLGAFCGGALFLAIFYSNSEVVWVLAILAGAVLIGIIVELILSRGTRSLIKNLKWLLGAGVLCCLLVLGSRYDWTGYTTRLPDVDDVESVVVNYRGRYSSLSEKIKLEDGQLYRHSSSTELTDPESIAVLLEAHRIAVSDQPPMEFEMDGNYDKWIDQYPYYTLNIDYKLKNGRVMSRRYHQLSAEVLAKLAELEDKDEFIRNNHALFFMQDQSGMGSMPIGVTVYDALGGMGTSHTLSDSDMSRLVQAVQQDMLAESLQDILAPTKHAEGYLEFTYRYGTQLGHLESLTASVIIGPGYTNTLAALRELGIADELQPVEQIDQVVFSPIYYQWGDNNRVISALPGHKARYQEDYQEDGYSVLIDDQSEVNAAVDAARPQMFVPERRSRHMDLLLAYYYKEGQCVGVQLVQLQDLPADMQNRLQKYFNDMGAVSEDVMVAETVPTAEVVLEETADEQMVSSTDATEMAVHVNEAGNILVLSSLAAEAAV